MAKKKTVVVARIGLPGLDQAMKALGVVMPHRFAETLLKHHYLSIELAMLEAGYSKLLKILEKETAIRPSGKGGIVGISV